MTEDGDVGAVTVCSLEHDQTEPLPGTECVVGICPMRCKGMAVADILERF